MAIIRKIDGENQIVADKSIVSHEQLTGREAYGAHPISAIRKLPEKLHALKEKDIEQDNRLLQAETKVENLSDYADDINAKLDKSIEQSKGIALAEDKQNKGKLLFTDYNGNKTSVQGGFLPDEDTLSLNSNNEMIVKKIYTDNSTIIGDGVIRSPLELKNKPDELTIKTDTNKSQIYSGAIRDDSGLITPTDIIIKHSELDTSIETINNAIKDIQAYDSSQSEKISDLLTRTQGMGGYLNAYNFKTATPTAETLTKYAIQDIGNISDGSEIFNGTKVKNLYNNDIWILTNTPEWTDLDGTLHAAVFSWQNQGSDSTVATATNDGLFGLVTGSYNDFEGFIDKLGHITINGLEEELTSIDSKKVDKTDSSLQIYGTNKNGNQTTYALNTAAEATKDAIPSRALNGALYIPDASIENSGTIEDGQQAVNKKYVNTISIIKLDKVDNTSKNVQQVYASSKNGQEMITIGNIPASGTIPKYNENKTLKSSTPSEADDVTIKSYVDATVDDIKSNLVNGDNKTIVKNTNNTLSAVGLIDNNEGDSLTARDIIDALTICIYNKEEVVV